jgi:hypothetical protein
MADSTMLLTTIANIQASLKQMKAKPRRNKNQPQKYDGQIR